MQPWDAGALASRGNTVRFFQSIRLVLAVTGWRSWSASWMPVPQKVLGHQGVHVWLIEAGSDRARQRTSSTPAAYTATHHLCPAPREQFGWSSPKPRGGLTGFYVPLRPKPLIFEMSGGNDGLNTVVPYTDDAYYRARP